MRPIRSFSLLLIFMACFTGLHYIGTGGRFFPSLHEFIPTSLIAQFSEYDGSVDSLIIGPTDNPGEKVPGISDTLSPAVAGTSDTLVSVLPVTSDTLSIAPDSLISSENEGPKTDPLRSFLDSLEYSKEQIRVMYYGDSQIEGDRITSHLRHILRTKAGGTGPGLFLPVMPVMYTQTTWLKSSSAWKRYNYLSYRNDEISHRKFGPFMAVCRYLPEGESSTDPVSATVSIRPSKMADIFSSRYDQLRIFYRNTEGQVNVRVLADEKEVLKDTLSTSNRMNEISCFLNNAFEIKIEFSGNVSPDIYGLSIESNTGVILDNIPQRGSAGLEFTMVDKRNLKESYNALSPDLFILQYGLNIVRNVREDYSYYLKGLKRQLALLREVAPRTPILIIGLTDMALKEGDSVRSYRNIPYIIEAQKQAALDENVTFWDSYSAMGGNASIIRWAEMQPPLAQKDLVHLTYPGADTLSKMIADSLFARKEREDTIPLAPAITQIPEVNTEPPVSTVNEITEGHLLNSLTDQVFKYEREKPLIFTTSAFWIFFLIVLAGYSIVYKKMFIRNFYLLLVSMFFYYKSGGIFLSLLIAIILIDYTVAILIHRSEKKFVRRSLIFISIISNLSILAYFKYTGLIVNTVNDLMGTSFITYDFIAEFSNFNFGTAFNISNILLPVGISFFTFQSMSYTLDVYRRKMPPVRSLIDFGFFVSFFPQLVAGPIVRASEFMPQLYEKFHLERREFSHALFLISKGLIKKIIISDFLAVNFIDRVFESPSIYSGFENLMAIYGYGLQIYCDFSGYTDIAIGLALILGFRLPFNFNSPYKASGVSDFWKRWHISLSRWLKDYLYIPLGGNRKGKFRTNVNLLITMLLGGLWHGADLRFIIWGLLHGLGLVFERIWNSLTGGWLKGGKALRAFSVFLTFQFVSFCWIFFRAPDIDSIKIMLSQIFENFSPGSYTTVLMAYSSVMMIMGIGYLIHFLPEKIKESYRGLFIRIPLPAQLAVIMVVAVILFQMRSTESMPFIYFRF